MSKEREAFEQWARGNGYIIDSIGGNYQVASTLNCWVAWQAAKAQAVQNTNHVIKALEDHLSINLDSDREDDGHSYWSGYNVALSEVESVMIEAQEPADE